MDQTKSIKLQKKRLESAEERRARLDKANERARAKRRMETEKEEKRKRRKKKEEAGEEAGEVPNIISSLTNQRVR